MDKLLISALVVPLISYSVAWTELINYRIVENTCEFGETIPLENHGMVAEVNGYDMGKEWSKESRPNARQCVSVIEANDGQQYACWDWNWQIFHKGVAYTELFFGQKPWFRISTTDILPTPLKELEEATIAYNVLAKTEGPHSLAINLWLVSDVTKEGPLDHLISDEILIVMDHHSMPTEGEEVANNLLIDNTEYTLYKIHKEDFKRDFFTFVSSESKLNSKVNLKSFIDSLTSKGHLTKSTNLVSISIGHEVASGSTGTSCYSLSDLEIAINNISSKSQSETVSDINSSNVE